MGKSLDYIMELLGEDASLVQEIVETYLHDSKKYLDEIKQGIDAADYDVIRNASHSLAGTSSNFNPVNLIGLAKTMNQLAKSRDLEKSKDLFSALRSELEQLHRDLQEDLKGVKAA